MKPTKKMRRKEKTTVDIHESSGNVFADLGLGNPEEMLAKAQLVHRVAEIIAERKLTQVEASRLLGIDQPKVSALLHGKLDGFSMDRLFRLLNALGKNVEIVIRSTPTGQTADTRVASTRRRPLAKP